MATTQVNIQEINITELPRANTSKPVGYCACLDANVVNMDELNNLKEDIKTLSYLNSEQDKILSNLTVDLDDQVKAYEVLVNKISDIFDELESNLTVDDFKKLLSSSDTLDDLFLELNKNCFVKGVE